MSDQSFNIRDEDQILLLCARTHLKQEIQTRLIKLIHKDIDWGYIINKSYEHKVSPLLYWNLNTIYEDIVPKDVIKELKAIFQENAKNNLVLLGELIKILKKLKSHEIIAIPYKGPTLAVWIYNNLAFRMFNDIDIFIFSNDVLKVRDILISYGYVPEIELNHKKSIKYVNSQREMRFFNNNIDLTLDLHWKFHAQMFSLPEINHDNLRKNLVSKKINDIEVQTLTNEDMLLMLCLHNAGHRWARLAWICDVNELINTGVDLLKVVKSAEKLYIKRILLINLNLARDLLDLEIPHEISDFIEKDKNVGQLTDTIKQKIFGETEDISLFQEIQLSLKMRDKLSYGIKDAMRNATVPTPLEWNELNLPIFLYPLYYIYRPFNLLIKYKLK